MLDEKSIRVKNKLEEFGKALANDIEEGRNPTFETAVRTRSNTIFDEKSGILRLGNMKEERSFMNIAQTKKFMQTLAIAAKCHTFINENLHTSIRGLYYQLKYSLGEDVDENLFSEQSESNPLIEDLETALEVKR